MALADHLRELRARLLMVSVALVVGIVVAWFFYDALFGVIRDPYDAARERLTGRGVETEPVISGVASPLLLRLKISALAAVVATSPFWLYQIWAFIVPGLHAHEKRWTQLFSLIAGPLFLAGVGVAYYVLPRGMEVLIGFTPAEGWVMFGLSVSHAAATMAITVRRASTIRGPRSTRSPTNTALRPGGGSTLHSRPAGPWRKLTATSRTESSVRPAKEAP